jgi:NarL family two-component system response regulator YdfI
MSDIIRVLITDDHQVVREGLRLMLEASREFEVVGDAADGVTALYLVEELQPDMVLMDLRMPGMDGLEAIQAIKARWPHIAVVILTTYNEDELVIRGLRAGAASYVLKEMSGNTLFHTLRAAARRETLLQPEILSRLLTHTNAPVASEMVEENPELTEREREILAAVVHGKRNKEIAARLYITESTVKAHLTNIYGKLGVDSRAAAVAAALARGIVT